MTRYDFVLANLDAAAVNQILYPGHLYARARPIPHQYLITSAPAPHGPRATGSPHQCSTAAPTPPVGPLPLRRFRLPPEPHQLPRDFRRPVAVLAWVGLGLGLGFGFRLGIGLGLGFGLGFGFGFGFGFGLGLGLG